MKVLISISIWLFVVFMSIFFMINFHEEQFRYRLDEKIAIKGKIRQLTQINYHLNSKNKEMQLYEQIILGYDTSNHIVSGAIYSASYRDTLKFYYKNDTGRNQMELIRKNVAERINTKYRCLYEPDDHNNSIEIEEYYIDTKTDSNEEFRYHVDYYCGMNAINGIGGIIITKFDNFGNLIEWKHVIHDTEVVGNITGKYDNNGNIIEENGDMVYEGEQHRKLMYKYENIDTNGNWLKRTTFKDKKVYEIEKRKIEYF